MSEPGEFTQRDFKSPDREPSADQKFVQAFKEFEEFKKIGSSLASSDRYTSKFFYDRIAPGEGKRLPLTDLKKGFETLVAGSSDPRADAKKVSGLIDPLLVFVDTGKASSEDAKKDLNDLLEESSARAAYFLNRKAQRPVINSLINYFKKKEEKVS